MNATVLGLNQYASPKEMLWSCTVIRLGGHVVVKGEDEEAIVTAVHPDSQVEIEFLHTPDNQPRRRRYAAEALEKISRTF
jgi:hypothetical protein